jgi:inner membrane protein
VQNRLFYKSLIVFALTVVIGIALASVDATVASRARFHDEAVQSIATESVREQTMAGPLLVVPYVEEYDETVAEGKTVHRSSARRHLIYPDSLAIDGAVDTDRRYRGIHQVLVYSGRYAVKGDFVVPARLDLERAVPNSTITFGAPYVALAIADVRGIRNLPQLNWNGGTAGFEQGTGLESLRSGIHAPLTAADLAAGKVAFQFELGLDGIEQMRFVPVGRNNRVTLKSPWPHPQFGGRFLPDARAREVGKDGFKAAWTISSLASGAQQQLRLLEDGAKEVQLDSFGVGFIEPVNIYTQADRAASTACCSWC